MAFNFYFQVTLRDIVILTMSKDPVKYQNKDSIKMSYHTLLAVTSDDLTKDEPKVLNARCYNQTVYKSLVPGLQVVLTGKFIIQMILYTTCHTLSSCYPDLPGSILCIVPHCVYLGPSLCINNVPTGSCPAKSLLKA